MGSLSVTSAQYTTRREFDPQRLRRRASYPHNYCVSPFTSKKRVLLLTVLTSMPQASYGTEKSVEV